MAEVSILAIVLATLLAIALAILLAIALATLLAIALAIALRLLALALDWGAEVESESDSSACERSKLLVLTCQWSPGTQVCQQSPGFQASAATGNALPCQKAQSTGYWQSINSIDSARLVVAT